MISCFSNGEIKPAAGIDRTGGLINYGSYEVIVPAKKSKPKLIRMTLMRDNLQEIINNLPENKGDALTEKKPK